MRTRSTRSHAGYVAELAAQVKDLERRLSLQGRENISLRRHAASSPSGRAVLAKLRDRRMAWMDETRDRPRDVP